MVWDMLNYSGRAVVSLKKDGIYSSPKRSWISDHTEDAYKRLLKAFKTAKRHRNVAKSPGVYIPGLFYADWVAK